MLSALAGIPEEQRVSAAILMAFLVGLIQTMISLFRFGDLSRYISHAVIVGFTLGASALLLIDQFKNVFGLNAPIDPHDHFLVRFWTSISMSDGVHIPTMLVALGTMAITLTIRAINRKTGWWLPEFLIALVLISWAVATIDPARESGLILTEAVPQALPRPGVPEWDWNIVRDLSDSAVAIAFLGLLEAMAMAKSIAARTGEKLDMNQQCLSEGLANTVGSFFHCFPGSGSLTRTYINYSAGAATQWSGVISAMGVAATVLVFAPLAAYIPRAALAGILVLTALRMTEIAAMTYMVKATRFDAWILGITASSAVMVSVEFCILIGVMLSFALYIPKVSRITVSELTVTGNRVIRELQPNDTRCQFIRLYNLEGEMFFGSSQEFERILHAILDSCNPELRIVILRLKRARNPDSVCTKLLHEFIEGMHSKGRTVMLTGVSADVSRVFANVGILDLVGTGNVFREETEIWKSTMEALQRAYQVLGTQRCTQCHRQLQNASPDDWSYMI